MLSSRKLEPMSRSRFHAHATTSTLPRHEPGEFRALVQAYPVIPAVRAQADLARAVLSPSRVVYLLAASLSTLDEYLQVLRGADKEVIVNLDLFGGLSRDSQAVAYLASSGCAGIISTHTDVLGAAQSQALYAVQRTFLIDSDSVTSCMRSMRHFLPGRAGAAARAGCATHPAQPAREVQLRCDRGWRLDRRPAGSRCADPARARRGFYRKPGVVAFDLIAGLGYSFGVAAEYRKPPVGSTQQ